MSELEKQLLKFANEQTCPVNENLQPGFIAGAYWGWGEARNRIRQILDKNSPKDEQCLS